MISLGLSQIEGIFRRKFGAARWEKQVELCIAGPRSLLKNHLLSLDNRPLQSAEVV